MRCTAVASELDLGPPVRLREIDLDAVPDGVLPPLH